MYIVSVPNRNSPPAVLLRESYREDGRVKNHTLANLSALPTHAIEGLKVFLKGGMAVASMDEVFELNFQMGFSTLERQSGDRLPKQ